ncbi:transcriptional repressor DicA [compost metagenome]|uniref:Helix-turn-helix transcriptional regulator n=1 Tax=Sphingobacterium paramultivorum TaxID=2886510 RepID=A0A7G5E4L4_9SPHI|nr:MULTISPECIES: helix-turn-helix transcriptional regulator [Sphingobacterium]QMV68939.1 helix-turn-helix transcriptional regulator [Sphingobacterium paramultivorum]WSO12715.1 helix-turn-helix transcriptional regulator [Sphingobacterium paramultivorum]
MTTGTKIRLLREQKGWGQDVLAAKLNISQPAISKLESDQNKLSWDNAVTLGELFEVDPEYFFDSKVNNYISHNQKVNQLFNSDYNDNNIEFIKGLYETQIKSKDELLQERYERIEDFKRQVEELKTELAILKKV